MEYYRFTIHIPKQPWPWIRFRITTILLLVAIVAMALAWRRDRAELTAQIYRLQNPGPNWESAQATGPPNTGTNEGPTAWCSLTADDQQEWLVLEFEEAVVPKAIVVHENHSPGAVYKVSAFDSGIEEEVLWEGTDPTPTSAPGGVSRLPVTRAIETNRIKVYFDSPAVPGWNEVDAVGIVYGANNKTIWAKRATASSSWSEHSTGLRTYPQYVLTY